jgi:hypothetical protein
LHYFQGFRSMFSFPLGLARFRKFFLHFA